MSVIAHWIEQRGISTVVIGLVKEHLSKITPPRALWVPFELGRPIGAPDDHAFQRHVLITALAMISTNSKTATLADFTQDDPRAAIDTTWRPPRSDQPESVTAEVQALRSAREKFTSRRKRTTVGVAKIDINECAMLIDSLRDSEPSKSPRHDISPVLMALLAIDDLKAYYIEAALENAAPSSRQIHDWFWQATYLGSELQRLRQQWITSDNEKLKRLGQLFIVPHRWRQT